jgi:hypothetical protein
MGVMPFILFYLINPLHKIEFWLGKNQLLEKSTNDASQHLWVLEIN